MISMPPSERDLHAYVDHQLSDDDRRQVETFLASNPEVAAQVRAWQQDAQQLRAALSGALQQPANPDLDPALLRQRRTPAIPSSPGKRRGVVDRGQCRRVQRLAGAGDDPGRRPAADDRCPASLSPDCPAGHFAG